MKNGDLIFVRDCNDSISPWSIIFDGYFKENVEKHMLEEDMPQESVDAIFANASRILSQCPRPYEQREISETGIIIGKVQSGKTSNFLSVLALAFDNGYDIAVVLGGNTLELLKQNATRIEETFSVEPEKLTVLKTDHNASLINAERIKEFIENGRKIIIVGLKHYKHINIIAEIFDNRFLAGKPVLVIDDEGDQAILNTKAYLDSMSSTYQSVMELKSKLKRNCLLSITATPQANILIQSFDQLSPDFGELVYPGEGYCGLQEFHGENSDHRIYEIPANEPDILESPGIPPSLFQAIAMFFVGNAIRRSRGDTGNHAMLIHPSREKNAHKIVVGKLDRLLEIWKEKAKNRNDMAYRPLQECLKMAYHKFVEDGVICVPFEELESTTLDLIKKCSPVHLCNSDENASANSKLYKTNIFVGGNLLERGITIKGLAITYITRRAKGKSNVDNTEQRARWFGYKEKYIDVCRVFTTKNIKDDFVSILEHDEDMWASIERARDRGIPFKEMPRIFKLSRQTFLQLTRRNVARTAQYGNILSEWKPQRFFIADRAVAERNLSKISDYRKRYEPSIIIKEYSLLQRHALLKNQCYSDVYNNLLLKLEYHPEEILNKEYFTQLNEALQKVNLDPTVDICWIRDDYGSNRKVGENGYVQSLFQGRNPNPASEKYYKGDRSLPDDEPDHIHIQIHKVKPTNNDSITFYSPMLAIYIPECYLEKISNMVVRSNG